MAQLYKVKTQLFEGPFDLLLSLVSKQKLDVGALSLSEIIDQYLHEVKLLEDFDLEVASDFLLVASSLLELKARALLPQEDQSSLELDDDFEFDNLSADEIREVLVERLITYKQFKNVSLALNSRMLQESYMHPRTAGPDKEYLNYMPDYLEGMTLRSLAVIAADLLGRRQDFLLEAQHIAPKRIPMETQMKIVSHLISQRKHTTFSELLSHEASAEEFVVTFLAILELFKQNKLQIRQDELFGKIWIKA